MWGGITGLTAEAALLTATPLRVAIGGGTPAGAIRAAQSLLDQGATALISFGLAGGLNPTYRPGTLLIPRAIITGSARYPCDPDLCHALGGTTGEVVLGHDVIAATRAEKSALFAATGAAAIDLESGAVATCAAANGIKFAALRAIADPAWRDLPPLALNALDASGKIRWGFVLRELWRQPGDLPGLVQIGADANRARRTLKASLIQCRWPAP
jgi:adenosylhomocysteine nucleosidase